MEKIKPDRGLMPRAGSKRASPCLGPSRGCVPREGDERAVPPSPTQRSCRAVGTEQQATLSCGHIGLCKQFRKICPCRQSFNTDSAHQASGWDIMCGSVSLEVE